MKSNTEKFFYSLASQLYTKNDKFRSQNMQNTTVDGQSIYNVTIDTNKAYFIPLPQRNSRNIVTRQPNNTHFIQMSRESVKTLKKISDRKSNSP